MSNANQPEARETRMFGLAIQARRQAMEMSLNMLSREMGGSPGPSFLSKLESGQVEPSPRVASRLASALNLPSDLIVNAAGYATEVQRNAALEHLREMTGQPAPVVMTIPVMEANQPDRIDSGGRRQRLVRTREDYFLVDLQDRENAPFVGEVLAIRGRKPQENQGVVAEIAGRASAWVFHDPGKSGGGPYLENALGDKRDKDYKILGVITRVVSELEFG